MSAEIEQAEPQEHKTLARTCLCIHSSIRVGDLQRAPSKALEGTPSPAFRVREESRKVVRTGEFSCFQIENISSFFTPHRDEESRSRLPGQRGYCLLSWAWQKSFVAEVKAMRKLCKEAGWWLKREELRVPQSNQSRDGIWGKKGHDSWTSTEVTLL